MELFYRKELRDIVIAVAAVTLIFSFQPFAPYIDINNLSWYFIAVVLVFLFHELAHRFVARKFNCVAMFKLWPQGLLIGMVSMLLGIKFVAPGAVVIYPYKFGRWGYRHRHLTQKEMGLIALAGLSVNLFFAGTFRIFSGELFQFLTFVSSWWFFFNLLPIPPLDGSKVLHWSSWVWFLLFTLGLLLMAPYFI